MRRRAEGSREGTRPGDPSPGPPGRSFILTVNGGSSSLKFALFDRGRPARAGRSPAGSSGSAWPGRGWSPSASAADP